jgi:actin-related protein
LGQAMKFNSEFNYRKFWKSSLPFLSSKLQFPVSAKEETKLYRPPVIAEGPADGELKHEAVENQQDNSQTSTVSTLPLPSQAPESAVELTEMKTSYESIISSDGLLPLDNAIVMSVFASSEKLNQHLVSGITVGGLTQLLLPFDEERIARLFNCILLVGGGLSQIPGCALMLENRVRNSYTIMKDAYGFIPGNNSLNVPSFDVTVSPRELDAKILAWKGASITVKLDSYLNASYWLRAAEWDLYGYEELKERCSLN